MKLLSETFESCLASAVSEAVETTRGFEPLTASAAISQYGLTWSDIKKVKGTFFEGKSKPVYLRKNIESYVNSRPTTKTKKR